MGNHQAAILMSGITIGDLSVPAGRGEVAGLEFTLSSIPPL